MGKQFAIYIKGLMDYYSFIYTYFIYNFRIFFGNIN